MSRARKLIGPVFNTHMRGLPGNDDAGIPSRCTYLTSGSLGAYLVWILSGLFPIAGQSVYLIIPPAFPEVQWTVTGSRIITYNFSPNAFIQNVTVNGQPVTFKQTCLTISGQRTGFRMTFSPRDGLWRSFWEWLSVIGERAIQMSHQV